MFHRARNLSAILTLLLQGCCGFRFLSPRRRHYAVWRFDVPLEKELTRLSLSLQRRSTALLASEARNQDDEMFDAFLSKLDDSLHSNTFQSFTIYGASCNKRLKKVKSRGGVTESVPPPGSLKLLTGRLVQLKPRSAAQKRARNSSSQSTTTVMHTTVKYHGATDIAKNWAVLETSELLRQLFLRQSREALAGIASEWGDENLLIPPVSPNGTAGLRGILETCHGSWELQTARNQYQLKHRERPSSELHLTTSAALSHDRTKQVPVPTTVDFWQALGVTNEFGRPKPGMASKVRQCQKFVETVAQLLPPDLDAADVKGSNQRIRVTDMGCGRGYLTFALHSYLQQRVPSEKVHTIGVDVRPKLVAELNGIVENLQTSNLQFEDGTIQKYMELEDLVANSRPNNPEAEDDLFQIFIALHACDTATDDALYSAIQRRANVIVTAPCCHKELRPQLDLLLKHEHHPLFDVLRHGIYRERTSETVTDSLRALLLELAGYKTRVFEFVGGEHTAKNCMITGVLRDKFDPSLESMNLLRQRIQSLAAFYGIRQQRLAEWMGEQALLQPIVPNKLTNRSMPPL